jgi:P4 family phage/plasmid primase-like protien
MGLTTENGQRGRLATDTTLAQATRENKLDSKDSIATEHKAVNSYSTAQAKSDTLATALTYQDSGLSIIPIIADGSKRPALEWKRFQSEIATRQMSTGWFRDGRYGIGLVCGSISGNREAIDFDDPAIFEPWCQMLRDNGGGNVLNSLVIVQTPRPGYQVHYRCSVAVEGNQDLALRQIDSTKVISMIETRGDGGYTLAPGSPLQCHPNKTPYEILQGDYCHPPVLDASQRGLLLACARSFNEYVKPSEVITGRQDRSTGNGLRPGEDYNARGDLRALLERHGWKFLYQRGVTEHWQRPGKDGKGPSATYNYADSGLFYVFSSNAYPFEMERSYNPFAVYTFLEHSRDFKAATKALAAEEYGQPAGNSPVPNNGKNEHKQPAAVDPDEPTVSTLPSMFGFNDMGNAQRLIAKHGKDLRYCHPWKNWLVWDGTRWTEDLKGQIKEYAKDTARSIVKESEGLTGNDWQQCLKHAAKSQDKPRIEAMVSLAQTEPGIPITPGELDNDLWLLNVKNGTIDLRTGEKREHNRGDLISRLAPVVYDPAATCPTFMAFLDRIMAGNAKQIDFLQTAVGYSLTASTRERIIIVLYGGGRNGKSTLLATIRGLLGDYANVVRTETLMMKKQDEIPADLADLFGARFVSADETEKGQRLNESQLKRIAGGTDELKVRRLHENFFRYTPNYKVWLGCNHKPDIKGTDEAIWDRIRLVPFDVRISDDEIDQTLPDKLKAELSGILNWALEGCLKWQQHGLGVTDEIKQATQQYRREQDALADFIDTCCIVKPAVKVSRKQLHEEYLHWCETNGEDVLSQKAFASTIQERNGVTDGGNSGGVRKWKGIGLISDQGGEPELPEVDTHDTDDTLTSGNSLMRNELEKKPESAVSSVSSVSDSQGADNIANENRILAYGERYNFPVVTLGKDPSGQIIRIEEGQSTWEAWLAEATPEALAAAVNYITIVERQGVR